MKTKDILCMSIPMLLAVGCDITDRLPEDAITDQTYWKKVDDLKAYARGLYGNLPGPGGRYPDESRTDISVEATPSDYLLTDAVIVPTGSDGWDYSAWSGIRTCNYFLNRYQTVEGDQAEIDHYVGEVKFFRALLYFNKVREFGDVPWYDRDLQTNDNELLHKARDPRLTVVANIVADLEDAVSKLKKPALAQWGQLHKDAALALLARVCLYEATWQKYRNAPESAWKPLMQKAQTTAKRIMDGEFGKQYAITKGVDVPAGTLPNNPLYYKRKFMQEDLKSDPECILARVYDPSKGVYYGLNRVSSKGLSKDFIDQFLCSDGKPIALSAQYMGDDSVPLELQNRDPRLRNILDCEYNPFSVSPEGVISANKYVPLTSSGENETVTGYRCIKYKDPLNNQPNDDGYDWYVFRFAETLLVYAEASVELGVNKTEAVEAVNKLRERLDDPASGFTMGRLTENPDEDPMQQYTKFDGSTAYRYGVKIDPLLYEIRRERTVELAFDGFRWDDICRWKAGAIFNSPKTMCGVVVNAFTSSSAVYDIPSTAGVVEVTETFNGTPKTRKLLRAYNDNIQGRHVWNDSHYLRPLPKQQIIYNPALTQNCGYEGGAQCP